MCIYAYILTYLRILPSKNNEFTKDIIVNNSHITIIMMIPGEGEVKDNMCGTVKGYQKCPECGYKTEMLHNCGRVQCPECYMHWVSKSAKRISQRVHGFAETLRNYPKSGDCIIVTTQVLPPAKLHSASKRCAHLILSPPQTILKETDDLKRCYDLAAKHLKKHMPDLIGAEIIFHPYRIRDEIKTQLRAHRLFCKKQYEESSNGFWEMVHDDVLNLGSIKPYVVFSPHYHLLAFGYFPKADEYHQKSDGWIYKNKRSVDLSITTNPDGTFNDPVAQVSKYLLTHVGVELTEDGRAVKTHRSYKLMTSRYLHKQSGYSFDQTNYVLCPNCLEQGEAHELILTDEQENPLSSKYYDMDYHAVIENPAEPAHVRAKLQIPNYSLDNPKPRRKHRYFVVTDPSHMGLGAYT